MGTVLTKLMGTVPTKLVGTVLMKLVGTVPTKSVGPDYQWHALQQIHWSDQLFIQQDEEVWLCQKMHELLVCHMKGHKKKQVYPPNLGY